MLKSRAIKKELTAKQGQATVARGFSFFDDDGDDDGDERDSFVPSRLPSDGESAPATTFSGICSYSMASEPQ